MRVPAVPLHPRPPPPSLHRLLTHAHAPTPTGAPILGVFGGLLELLVLSCLLTLFYALQYADTPLQDLARTWWPWASYGYVGLYALHFVLTTRDG